MQAAWKDILRIAATCAVACAGLFTSGLQAYNPENHQELTFIAAKELNRCLAPTLTPRLTALQVRHAARSNYNLADSNVFARLFRWNYYNRLDATDRSLWFFVDTRLHKHFNLLDERLSGSIAGESRRYDTLGRVLSYLQDVTTPSRAVPVFTNRFWRFSFSDRFDHFPIDSDAVTEGLQRSCDYVLNHGADMRALLQETADETVVAVQAPIFGLPSTWEAFWQLAEQADDFGEFGPAGNNFGRGVEFACGEDEACVLLENDPLYRNFARERHIAAVMVTMRALYIAQQAAPAARLD